MFSDPQKNIGQLNLDPGMLVADFGSGSGFYTIEAARAVGPSGKVYSIDIQRELLKRTLLNASRDHLHNIEIITGDLEKAGGARIKDSLVNFVIVANLLFQIGNKKNLLDEAKRILKPQGKLAIIDWTDSFGGIGPRESEVVDERKARALAEEAGFTFERKIQAGEHHYGLVFKKI